MFTFLYTGCYWKLPVYMYFLKIWNILFIQEKFNRLFVKFDFLSKETFTANFLIRVFIVLKNLTVTISLCSRWGRFSLFFIKKPLSFIYVLKPWILYNFLLVTNQHDDYCFISGIWSPDLNSWLISEQEDSLQGTLPHPQTHRQCAPLSLCDKLLFCYVNSERHILLLFNHGEQNFMSILHQERTSRCTYFKCMRVEFKNTH